MRRSILGEVQKKVTRTYGATQNIGTVADVVSNPGIFGAYKQMDRMI